MQGNIQDLEHIELQVSLDFMNPKMLNKKNEIIFYYYYYKIFVFLKLFLLLYF